MNFRNIFFIFFIFSISAEEIEIRLKTATPTKPIYIARTYLPQEVTESSYSDELRSILAFDFNTGGFATVLPAQARWDESLYMADIKRHFNLNLWRKEKVPFIICSAIVENALKITAFDVDKGSSKTYEVELTNQLDEDRIQIHRVADAIHKDLFGLEGISSCRLIYSQREKKPNGNWRCEIYTADFDGANARQLTFEDDYCVTPCFSPNLETEFAFFYVSYKTGQSKIYRSSLKQKTSEIAFDLGGNQLLPAVNAKGSQLAFISDAAGRPDLFIQDIDSSGHAFGKPRQIFSAPRATQASPTFSPDGRKIAFVSDKDGSPRIYLLDLTNNSKVRPYLLTKKNRENISPAWSPNGRLLAYSAKVDGARQIWIYNFETEEEFALTSGTQNKENPSWAPDSLHLVYNTDNDDDGELYLIHLNQKTPVQITKGAGQKRFATWGSGAKGIQKSVFPKLAHKVPLVKK